MHFNLIFEPEPSRNFEQETLAHFELEPGVNPLDACSNNSC